MLDKQQWRGLLIGAGVVIAGFTVLFILAMSALGCGKPEPAENTITITLDSYNEQREYIAELEANTYNTSVQFTFLKAAYDSMAASSKSYQEQLFDYQAIINSQSEEVERARKEAADASATMSWQRGDLQEALEARNAAVTKKLEVERQAEKDREALEKLQDELIIVRDKVISTYSGNLTIKKWDELFNEPITADDRIVKEWESIKEVRDYVKATGIPALEYKETTFDCDDFAYALYEQALEDNRQIGLFTVMKYIDRKLTQYHFMNFVAIGNNIYQVEPQNGNVNPLGGWNATID